MKNLTDHLRTIIAFRSVGKDAAQKSACLDWIAKEFLPSTGIVRGIVDGSPYLFLPHDRPQLLWFGHVDVVPGADEQFTLLIEGDIAYGRGVKDMKGATLAFLIAYKEACDSGRVPPVSILVTTDEETGGHTPPALLQQKAVGMPPVAYTPDNGEGGGIITELKGALWAKLTATGKGGHGAMPWIADNPVPRLLDAIQTLQAKYPVNAENNWHVSITPTKLSGSDAINRIADQASCVLDVRFPGEVWKSPEEAATALARQLPPGCRLEQLERADPMRCPSDHPMVLRIKRLADAVTGVSNPITREHGSSDARCFVAAGIPAFLFGPVGGDLHGANEWVSLRSLEQQVEINRRLLAELST